MSSVKHPKARATTAAATILGAFVLAAPLYAATAADAPEPIIAFMRKLEASDVFGSVAPSGFTPPSQTNPFVRYQLTVNYAQKL